MPGTSRELSVSLVEDDRATRDGLALLIEGTPGFKVVATYGAMEEAIVGIPKSPPDVLLCDIELPGMSGIEGVRQLKSLAPSVQILMLTVFADNDHVFEAICAGASGYLLKGTPPARLLGAIRELQAGGAPMSPEIARKVVTLLGRVAPPPREEHRLSAREVEILKLLSDGHSYKTAAHELAISIDTVRFHIRNIYEKLHVHSKSEAVLRALRTGIVR